MNKIDLVSTDERLRDVWPTVRFGLEKIIDRTGETSWMPEDVYSEIRAGHTKLILGIDHSEVKGFLCITPQPAYDGKEANIWAFWLDCPLDDAMPFWGAVKDFCKNQLGCRRVVMLTTRKGWEKTSRALGLSEYHVQYKLDL
jgi:hypothetical protein